MAPPGGGEVRRARRATLTTSPGWRPARDVVRVLRREFRENYPALLADDGACLLLALNGSRASATCWGSAT